MEAWRPARMRPGRQEEWESEWKPGDLVWMQVAFNREVRIPSLILRKDPDRRDVWRVKFLALGIPGFEDRREIYTEEAFLLRMSTEEEKEWRLTAMLGG